MPGTQWENTEIQRHDLPQDFLQKPITDNIVADVGQPTEVLGDEVNRWRLFFPISANQFISLDMVNRGADNPRGIVEVLGNRYPVSNRGVLGIPMIPASGLTVAKVLDLLESEGMLRYQYTQTGDCRFWIQRVVGLLMDNQLLDNANERFPQFDDRIGYLWRPGPHEDSQAVGTPKAIEPGFWYRSRS